MKALRCFQSSGVTRAGLELKNQAPTSKHQRSSKSQAPISARTCGASCAKHRSIKPPPRLPTLGLVIDAWLFSGAWMLVLGASPSDRLTLNEGETA